MPGSRLNVHLSRDSFNTPWGFRLQGGKDLNQPLIVQRVFSNSPAEGELQRGDVILSINNRDTSQLTHKQAQDLIKHGGGQVQLVIHRPPPGTHVGPLSPPIITQTPRAPSLQLQSPSNKSPTSRQLTIHMVDTNFRTQIQSPHQQPHIKPVSTPLRDHIRPEPYNQQILERQRSPVYQPTTTPSPTTTVYPWASQQFTPKKIFKMSKLGGGGFNYGTVYSTLPRKSSSANYGGRSQTLNQTTPEQTEDSHQILLATGPVPKVCRLRNLGGGGFDLGSTYGSATFPRRSGGRHISQPGGSHTNSYGFQPTKVTLNKFGGHGPEFGADFSQKGHEQTAAQRYEPRHDKSGMLNRLQNSLDNLTLSPRTPEVHISSPFYSPFEQAYQPPQQVYTPTGLLLEQQRLQEEGEKTTPVCERRKQFQQAPDASQRLTGPCGAKIRRGGRIMRNRKEGGGISSKFKHIFEARTSANRTPRVPKPRPGPTTYGNFGTDYNKPSSNHSQPGWRPTPQFKPAQAPVQSSSAYHTPKPGPPYASAQTTPPSWQRKEEEDSGPPAWGNTLKATGIKPWDADVSYSNEQQPLRSVPYNSTPAKSPVSPGQFSPSGAPQVGGSENGPKVVHLQYNSPMYLYSNQNVAETLKGQTQALSGQTKPNIAATNESGERDWSQSAVLKFITQEDTKKGKQPPLPAVAPQTTVLSCTTIQIPQPFYQPVDASEF